ncbi:MAG TPA: tetratricopeptide repeat protein [Prolixibacteraceae bacterium]|nr:tetratricopeptide repeat protein [Prolixibacteraceae bacterium]
MAFMKICLSVLLLLVVMVTKGQYNDAVLQAFAQSYSYEKENNFLQSAAVLKKAYQEDSYEFNLRLGWLSYNLKNYEESKVYYKMALSLLPYSEEARFGLVLPLAANKEWNEVAKIYTQILENNPGNTVALYRLGLLCYERKDWAQAYRLFQKVVDFYPFGYDGLLMLAWTNLQMGKNREAKILFNKVILYSPGDKSALEGLKLLR